MPDRILMVSRPAERVKKERQVYPDRPRNKAAFGERFSRWRGALWYLGYMKRMLLVLWGPLPRMRNLRRMR